MEKNIKLSLIVPTFDQNVLSGLINSISELKSSEIELVVINQSKERLTPNLIDMIKIPCIDCLVDKLPAANARNHGATLANGEYLFFLDDDAVVYSGKESISNLLKMIDQNTDVVIVQRGGIKNGVYVSHWPKGIQKLTYRNFPRIVIEWNLIIKKELFLRIGGFPEIGPGSAHAALSGEAFVLAAKMIGFNLSLQLCPSVQIAHPSLFEKSKNIVTALGYAYGSGYAVGLSLSFFNVRQKIYWFLRIAVASMADMLLRSDELIRTTEEIDMKKYKRGLAKCRLIGFFDALRREKPRSAKWVREKASGILKKGGKF